MKDVSNLKTATENVSLNIDAPKKLTLRFEKPATPPETGASGIIYLGGSPYGGEKSTKELPSDNPAIINVTVPMRSLESPLNFETHPENDSGDGGCKAPSKLLMLEYTTNGSFGESYVDVTYTNWPPLDYYLRNESVQIDLETLLNENLYTEIAYIYAIETTPGSYIKGFFTSDHPDMDVNATLSYHDYDFMFYQWAKDLGGFVRAAGIDETTGTLYQAYNVPLLVYTDEANNNTQCLYDKRGLFMDAISADAEHPFFRYLARCRENNPMLSSVLTAIPSLNVEQPDYNRFAGLIFLTNINPVKITDPDICCIFYTERNLGGKAVTVRFSEAQPLYNGLTTGRILKISALPDMAEDAGFNSVLYNNSSDNRFKLVVCADETEDFSCWSLVLNTADNHDESNRILNFDATAPNAKRAIITFEAFSI